MDNVRVFRLLFILLNKGTPFQGAGRVASDNSPSCHVMEYRRSCPYHSTFTHVDAWSYESSRSDPCSRAYHNRLCDESKVRVVVIVSCGAEHGLLGDRGEVAKDYGINGIAIDIVCQATVCAHR
jgi:hypothetical protein